MSKLFKLLLNRISVAIFLIIIQVCFIIFILKEASAYYAYIKLLVTAISAIYAIKILGKDIPITFKLPVLILIFEFPILGIFLYYFSFENRLRKKFAKNIKNQTFTLESLYIEDSTIKEQLASEDETIYRQSQYIANNSFLPVYQNNYTKYYPTGEAFFKDLLEDLKKAKSFIFLEFFIIGKGILWNSILEILKQKVRDGVEVRVIFDDIGSLKTLPYKYNRLLEKHGIKCVVFNPIVPILSLIHNNRDHKKIAIIDGQIAYTGGLNIADEYVNLKKRFGEWKDTGIKIVGDSAKSFILMFLESWHYFRDSSEECSIYLNVPPIIKDFSSGYIEPYIGDPMAETDVARGVYLNIIDSAKNYILITTPYFAVDYELQSALIAASKRGVKIKIIVPHIPDKKYVFRVTQSYYKPLLKEGLQFYEYTPGFIHSKMLLCDDKIATVGTINFDYRSFYHNYECGVWLYNTDSIIDIKNDFVDILNKSTEVTGEYIKNNIGLFNSFLGGILKLFAPLF